MVAASINLMDLTEDLVSTNLSYSKNFLISDIIKSLLSLKFRPTTYKSISLVSIAKSLAIDPYILVQTKVEAFFNLLL